MPTRPSRWWDLPAAFFLLAAMSTVAFRLSDTKWTEDLGVVITLTILGGLFGLALGYSSFKGWLVGLFSAVFTFFFIFWQLGRTLEGDLSWLERLNSTSGRLWVGIQTFIQNHPFTDPLPFLANMAFVFWLVSLIAAYNMTRHGRPWLGVLVGGVALLVIDIYHPDLGRRGFGMGVFVIFALLLVTRIYFLISSKRWEQNKIAVDSDTGWSFGRGALMTAVILVLLAWNVTSAVKAFTPATTERHDALSVWRGLRQRFENAVAPLRGSVPTPVEFYDDEFSLGTGAILTDDLVMTVDPSITRRIGVNYYWKMRSYDRYVDGMWISTTDQIKPYSPTDPSIRYGSLQGRISVRFQINTMRNLGTLFAPSLPLTFSRPVSLIYQPAEGEEIDLTVVEIDPMLRAGGSYEVYSWVASPTMAQLKTAGTDYPAWVTNDYLQLPAMLPQTIKDLALEITQGLETPYEKTAAITAWLRDNIAYAAVIPNPPEGADPIEWVLFTEKRAFCNYYATAEILMLRSLGIPARWVVGYAQGDLNEEKGYYEVRAKDSHAWPEVFFPGYGWIEFEPTGSQPVLNRPSGEIESNQNSALDPTGGTFLNDPRDRTFEEDPNLERLGERSEIPSKPPFNFTLALILAGIMLLAATTLFFIGFGVLSPEKTFPVLVEKALSRRGWRTPTVLRLWSSFVRLTPIERAFISVEGVARSMGGEIGVGTTPTEQVNRLDSLLPQGATLTALLLDEYQKAIYSPHPADLAAARKASRELWALAIKTRARMLLEFILAGKTQPASRLH